MLDDSCHFGDLYISEFYDNDLSCDDVVQPRKYSNHKSYELTNNYNKVVLIFLGIVVISFQRGRAERPTMRIFCNTTHSNI